jgi:ribonuclease HI
MSKFYAVKSGRKIGIFTSWKECEEQVKGFSNAVFKSFQTKEEALNYLDDKNKNFNIDGLIAYVDGSYNIKTKEYGYGCVIIDHQKVIKEIFGKDNKENYVSMRNVAGEIEGSIKAIEFAIEKGYSSICIYYDYAGIEKWANKEWKANKEGTVEYQNKIDLYRNSIQIQFMKVLAHSGDFYNEMADSLAKKAVGIHV